MNRTIAVRFVQSPEELEKVWEDAQFELSSKYQYEGVSPHVWDYYLVFCCNFGEDDIDKRIRFKIESDRFCCRKYFVFGSTKKNFDTSQLIERLFPVIKATKQIQIIKAETIMDRLGDEFAGLVPTSFFTEELEETSIEPLIESLIARRNSSNE